MAIVIGVWARFYEFSSQSIWGDEGYTLLLTDSKSASETARLLLELTGSNWYLAPAYPLVLSIWRDVFGSSEAALRSLSAIFGSMALLTVIIAAWRAWGRKWACWTAVFAALSGYSIYYSQEIRPYALLTWTTTLVLATYLECRDPRRPNPGRSARVALAVAACAAVWSSALSALFLVALAFVDLLVSGAFRRWLKIWLPAALSASTFAIWIVVHFLVAGEVRQTVGGFQAPFLLKAGFITTAISVGTTFGPPLVDLRGSDRVQVLLEYAPQYALLGLSLAIICGRLLAVGWMSWRASTKSDVRLRVLIGSTVLLFAMFLAIEAVASININPRHAVALWPLLCLTLPATVLLSSCSSKHWVRHIAISAVMLLITLNLLSLFNYFFQKEYSRDDYKSVANYIDHHKTFVPVLWAGSPTSIEYYSDQTVVDIRGPFHNLHDLIHGPAADWTGLIVIINRPFLVPDYVGERTFETLKPEFFLVEKKSLHYFHVYRFERANKDGL